MSKQIQTETHSVDELRALIMDALTACGFSPDYVTGYVRAQEIDGCLRPGMQPWCARSATARYQLMRACPGAGRG